MQSNRRVKGYLVKYLVLKADLDLCCDLVLLLKQRMKLGLDACFCTVITSGRRFFGGETVRGAVVSFSSVMSCILLADDLQMCRAVKESKSNCKAVNQVEMLELWEQYPE